MLRPDITLGKIEYNFQVVLPEIPDWEGRCFGRHCLILLYIEHEQIMQKMLRLDYMLSYNYIDYMLS